VALAVGLGSKYCRAARIDTGPAWGDRRADRVSVFGREEYRLTVHPSPDYPVDMGLAENGAEIIDDR
jgi:hypothetical protein